MTQQRLAIVPCSISKATEYVAEIHRHHPWKPSIPYFSVGVADETGTLRGVAIVGRPVSRILADGRTAEVQRVATDGCENACSALYGACWRAAKALGWRKLITYILESESGTSLKAAGWHIVYKQSSRKRTVQTSLWSATSRNREDKGTPECKVRWEVSL